MKERLKSALETIPCKPCIPISQTLEIDKDPICSQSGLNMILGNYTESDMIAAYCTDKHLILWSKGQPLHTWGI